MAYEAWLTEPNAAPLNLGVVDVVDGEALIEFTKPDGGDVLARYSGFALSLEPMPDSEPTVIDETVYVADVAPDTIQYLRLLMDVSQDVELEAALLEGLATEADHYNSHLGFAIDALNARDLAGAKSHSEHTINIAVGKLGEEYGDWNENDRVENPGNDVGLRTYLLVAKEIASSIALYPDATDEMRKTAETVVTSSGVLLETVDDAVRLAEQIATADSIDLLENIPDSLEGVLVDMAISALTKQVKELDPVFAVEVVSVEG
jgi:hypothetical protein